MCPFPPFDNQATKLKNQNHKLLTLLLSSLLEIPTSLTVFLLFFVQPEHTSSFYFYRANGWFYHVAASGDGLGGGNLAGIVGP